MLVALLSLVLTMPSGLSLGASAAPVPHAARPVAHKATHRRPAHRRPPVIPHLREWTCIHSHEAPTWRIADAPYYGGLQMDLSFQRAYGAVYLRTEGTANNWSPAQQMLAAERAWRARGFTPWPNTARMCGLL